MDPQIKELYKRMGKLEDANKGGRLPKSRDKTNLKGKIIGLWGDPGLTEYYNFDILSRFLIVQIAPYNEVPCKVDAHSIVKLVLRPFPLWIRSVSSGVQRRDFSGNINNQLRDASHASNNGTNPATFSDQNILPITPSYKVGDEITLKRLDKPLRFFRGVPADQYPISNGVDIFNSEEPFTLSQRMSSAFKNSSGYSRIASIDVFTYLENVAGTQDFKIVVNSNGSGGSDGGDVYNNALERVLTTSGKFNNIIRAGLAGEISNSILIASRGGEFGRFKFESVEYMDANIDNRERPKDSGCLPLIVTNPSTFPTPANRVVGGINITL